MTETIVHLKPREQWRPGMTLDGCARKWAASCELPGVTNIWTMPIINRIDMLSTGIRSEVGVKIYGSDLAGTRADRAAGRGRAPHRARRRQRVSRAAHELPVPERPRRSGAAAARYGLSVAAVQDVIETAIGERNLTTHLEGRRRFPVRVRYAPQFRGDPQALGQVLVATPAGQQLPLAQVADIEQARGPAMISSENGLLLATVLLNVQGRDIGGFVNEAQGGGRVARAAAARLFHRLERPL